MTSIATAIADFESQELTTEGLYNADLAPMPLTQRKWSVFSFAAP
jgi:cytosine/uracil/thiamine/allantoin permease